MYSTQEPDLLAGVFVFSLFLFEESFNFVSDLLAAPSGVFFRSFLFFLAVLLSFFGFFVLKSVSYQPVPFSLKAAAESSLRRLCELHSGHVFAGTSFIFCNISTL